MVSILAHLWVNPSIFYILMWSLYINIEQVYLVLLTLCRKNYYFYSFLYSIPFKGALISFKLLIYKSLFILLCQSPIIHSFLLSILFQESYIKVYLLSVCLILKESPLVFHAFMLLMVHLIS